jgi:uncharacterized membrane protein
MTMHNIYMGYRFLIYGLVGWIIEVVFTGTGSLMNGFFDLTGYTYLWMFPIYGLAVLLEPVHNRVRSAPWLVRGIIYVSIIFMIEYLSGWALKLIVGFCPWDYSGHTAYTVDGFIRLDYAPAWFVAGLLFEKLHDLLINLQNRLNNK